MYMLVENLKVHIEVGTQIYLHITCNYQVVMPFYIFGCKTEIQNSPHWSTFMILMY